MNPDFVVQVIDEEFSRILRGHYREEGVIQLFKCSCDLHARLRVHYRVVPQIALGVRIDELALYLRRLIFIIAWEYFDELDEVIRVAHDNLHHVEGTVAVE